MRLLSYRGRMFVACGWCVLLLTLSGSGCGPSASDPAANAGTLQAGPHGGPAVPLPGDAGFGEVAIEYDGRKAVIVAYFLAKDAKTPLTALPTGVSVSLTLPDQTEPVSVTLSPSPKPKDPAGAARFASAAGPYDVDRLIGVLSGSLGGQAFSEKFTKMQ